MMGRKCELAIEVPTAHLDELVGVVDWYFCIATECAKSEEYYAWHKENNRQPVMLDNGAYEEGAPMDIKDLIEVTLAINPEVVFAPDVLNDRVGTLELTREFIAKWREARPKSGVQTKIGVIPQGSDPDDIVRCYCDMRHQGMINFNPVGLSFLNDRREVMRLMTRRWLWDSSIWYHALGMYSLDETFWWPDTIKSMDTVKPIKGAMYGHDIDDVPRGLGKWDTNWIITEDKKPLLYRNLAKMHQALTED